jgi:hypothetical protein
VSLLDTPAYSSSLRQPKLWGIIYGEIVDSLLRAMRRI